MSGSTLRMSCGALPAMLADAAAGKTLNPDATDIEPLLRSAG